MSVLGDTAREAEELREIVTLALSWLDAEDGCGNCDPDNECYADCMNLIAEREKNLREALTIYRDNRAKGRAS